VGQLGSGYRSGLNTNLWVAPFVYAKLFYTEINQQWLQLQCAEKDQAMHKYPLLIALSGLALGIGGAAHAADLSFAVGTTDDSTMTYRLGVQCDFGRNFSESSTGRLTGYWDTAYTFWQGDKTADNHSVALTPVFVYEFAGETVKPYIEAGIGVALFSSTELEEQDLGSSFQFEDRLGVGLRFNGHEIGLRAMHYSNAGISSPNDGAENYSLHYAMAF
jgi:lipid A 3-O-deacylase